jgi:hypothetical protein
MVGREISWIPLLSLGQTASDAPLETKLCVLPSPINAYIMYGVMGILSLFWIGGMRLSWTRGREIEYIELDNLGKDEVTQRTRRKRTCSYDLQGKIRDCILLLIFVVVYISISVLNA